MLFLLTTVLLDVECLGHHTISCKPCNKADSMSLLVAVITPRLIICCFLLQGVTGSCTLRYKLQDNKGAISDLGLLLLAYLNTIKLTI